MDGDLDNVYAPFVGSAADCTRHTPRTDPTYAVRSPENGGHDGRMGKAETMGRTRLPIPCPALPDSRSLGYTNTECFTRPHPSPTKTAGRKEENHLAIVELREDIRVNTAQLADSQFFSSAFEGFTVITARTHIPNVPEWATLETSNEKHLYNLSAYLLRCVFCAGD